MELVLRTCKSDMTSHSGFTWPKSGPVEAADWEPTAECGHGLHGLLWGDGDWSLLRGELDAIWQVVEVDAADLVKIDSAKVKFKKGNVIFTGKMGEAVTMVLCAKIRFEQLYREAEEKSKATGHSSKAASSGDYSTAASSGDYSTAASSGDYSTAASSGNSSKAASSGNSSTAASSGNSSKAASSGNYSTAASSGNYSKAASSGNYSTAASSGDYSTAASSGDSSTAAGVGEKTIAMVAGINGQVKAGPNGAFAIAYLNKKGNPRILVGHVGEKGIKADTWYYVKNGRLAKV